MATEPERVDPDDPELMIGYAAIDMQIEEYLRHMEDDVLSAYEIDDEDRAMLVYCMRLSYIQGHKDALAGIVPSSGL